MSELVRIELDVPKYVGNPLQIGDSVAMISSSPDNAPYVEGVWEVSEKSWVLDLDNPSEPLVRLVFIRGDDVRES